MNFQIKIFKRDGFIRVWKLKIIFRKTSIMKTFNEIEKKLNKVSVKPLSEEEKGVLWRKIERGIIAPEKSPYWQNISRGFSMFRLRASIAFAVIVAILFGGTGVAFACESAKPGDFLFPVAVLKEKIVISLTPTQNQNEVRLKYAEKRIEQGNDILNTLRTGIITSTSTRVLADTIAISMPTTTPPAYHQKVTSSPAVVKNAVDRLSATIAYLQGVKADLLVGGNTVAAASIQTAIDKILEQVSLAANQNATVVAKIQEHKNQFNVVVSANNASTTTTVKLALNTKKDTQKITITEKENKPAVRIEEARNKGQAKKEEKKEEKKHENENRQNGTEDDNDNEDNEDDNKKGFFGWFGNDKKSNVCHKGETINISNSAVMAHLKHGDSVGVCNATTNTNSSDTTAPIVSNISTSVTPTTAKITWGTNENATAVFWYGTAGAFETSTEKETLADHQEINLSALSSDTTYSFVIAAKDGSGNVSTTTVQTFKTTVPLDTTAPVISDIVADHLSETATVSWETNENATGKIYYGIATPIVFASAPNTKLNDAYSLNHVFNLTGLATSTTYYFVLEGKDAAGNIGTSTEHQFTTGS
jgi:hypothetical protein